MDDDSCSATCDLGSNYVDGTNCRVCHSSCSGCDGVGYEDCTDCATDYHMDSYSQCCSDECGDCADSPTTCETCAEGDFSLSYGLNPTCYTNCPLTKYNNPTTFECTNCTDFFRCISCRTVDDPSSGQLAGDCLHCDPLDYNSNTWYVFTGDGTCITEESCDELVDANLAIKTVGTFTYDNYTSGTLNTETINSYRCEACASHCATCSGLTTSCLTCADGFFLLSEYG